VDDAGNSYVPATGHARIHKFDARGGYLGSWGAKGTAPGVRRARRRGGRRRALHEQVWQCARPGVHADAPDRENLADCADRSIV